MKYLLQLLMFVLLSCASNLQTRWVNSVRELAKIKKEITDSGGTVKKVIVHPNNVWELRYKEKKK